MMLNEQRETHADEFILIPLIAIPAMRIAGMTNKEISYKNIPQASTVAIVQDIIKKFAKFLNAKNKARANASYVYVISFSPNKPSEIRLETFLPIRRGYNWQSVCQKKCCFLWQTNLPFVGNLCKCIILFCLRQSCGKYIYGLLKISAIIIQTNANSFLLLGRKPGYRHHVSRRVFLGLCIFCTCHEYISYMALN